MSMALRWCLLVRDHLNINMKLNLERIIVYGLIALICAGLLYVVNELKIIQKNQLKIHEQTTDFHEQVEIKEIEVANQIEIIQKELKELQKTTAPLCYVRIDMVWETGRRIPYDFATDPCGENQEGYRCLESGGEITPSCYNQEECPSNCSGKCVNILEMRSMCNK